MRMKDILCAVHVRKRRRLGVFDHNRSGYRRIVLQGSMIMISLTGMLDGGHICYAFAARPNSRTKEDSTQEGFRALQAQLACQGTNFQIVPSASKTIVCPPNSASRAVNRNSPICQRPELGGFRDACITKH